MSFYRRNGSLAGLAGLITTIGLALAVAAPVAQASPEDPSYLIFDSEIFTPALSACTIAHSCNVFPAGFDEEGNMDVPVDENGEFIGVDYAGTTRAGANPQFTLRMRKSSPNHTCEDLGWPTECVPLGDYGAYIEQVTKNIAYHLPPGLLGDVNAAPYCEPEQRWAPKFEDPTVEYLRWFCKNPEAFVGAGASYNSQCVQENANNIFCHNDDPNNLVPGPGITAIMGLYVYNARPRPGEQSHLVVLVPDNFKHPITPANSRGIMKLDIGITARDDLTLDVVTDDIPDPFIEVSRAPGLCGYNGVPNCEAAGYIQVVDMVLTLNGSTGAENGHPYMTNPTFCDPQVVEAEFRGYAHNGITNYSMEVVRWAFGDGMLVKDSAPYQATDCDAIPYAPTFTASADSEAPGAAAALSTVITQKDDEATTKKVHVEFPKGMGVNINSTLTPCSAADLAAKSCPEVSKMGTVSAESRLLPKREILGDSVKPEDEVLTGSVYLTGQEGDKLTLSALLSGFVDVRLDAKAAVGADGTLTATFDDIPATSISKFTLNLFGGSKGLLTNSRVCGTHTTRATFTSHSGKTHTVETTSKVKGCPPLPAPEFEVDLSNNGKGKRTSVELDLSTRERHIKKVTFGLPRYLKFSTKRLGKAKRFGRLAIETERGELETSLSLSQSVRAKRKKKKAIRFSSKGALNDLKVNLFKRKIGTKKIKIRTKSGKKKTVKRSVLKSRMSLKSLPKQDIKGLTVELNPSESRFLRNPKGCKKPLRFLAFVTTSDGVKHVLSQKVKLKGKGCSKKNTKAKIAFTTLSGVWR